MVGLEPYKHKYYLWKYVPSPSAAVISCALFGIITIGFVWRIWKTHTWFRIPFALGEYMQFVGYACRAAASSRTDKLMPFVMQRNNILLALVLCDASVYMTLGRVIHNIQGENHIITSPRWLTIIFLAVGLFALAVQGSAARPYNVSLGNTETKMRQQAKEWVN